MTATHAKRQRILELPHRAAAATVVLVDDPVWLSPLVGRRLRVRDRALAATRGFSLDARLAAGLCPDTDQLMAARARRLVSPVQRELLARDWEHLLATAHSREARRLLGPLRRDRILAAEAEIRQLQRALRTTLPVPVRGVAIARHLLVDGTGPMYSPRACADLRTAVRDAVRAMDPTAELWQTCQGA